jgi:putative FmdB family regulatory protein
MPLYEYECAPCRKVHEVMQKFSDAPLAECPDCQGPVTKLMSRSSFALKGTGWYTTDYKRSSSATSASSSSSTASSTASAPAVSNATPVSAKEKSAGTV